MSTESKIFRRGSRTFYISSLFFPRSIRSDVFDLYSFVRTADDYVDRVPAEKDSFYDLKNLWESSVAEKTINLVSQQPPGQVNQRVVENMLRLSKKYEFDPAWITSFLKAMESDLKSTRFKTIDDTLEYIYGSAEVIGLMMAKIMNLKPEAYEAARLQGRAMQMINFIRDIEEDNSLGRLYFPADDLAKYGLNDLQESTARAYPKRFNKFIHFQISRYETCQTQATQGFHYIPRRLRVPVKTASEMYDWTALQIKQDPHVVYRKKIKPGKIRLLTRIISNILPG